MRFLCLFFTLVFLASFDVNGQTPVSNIHPRAEFQSKLRLVIGKSEGQISDLLGSPIKIIEYDNGYFWFYGKLPERPGLLIPKFITLGSVYFENGVAIRTHGGEGVIDEALLEIEEEKIQELLFRIMDFPTTQTSWDPIEVKSFLNQLRTLGQAKCFALVSEAFRLDKHSNIAGLLILRCLHEVEVATEVEKSMLFVPVSTRRFQSSRIGEPQSPHGFVIFIDDNPFLFENASCMMQQRVFYTDVKPAIEIYKAKGKFRESAYQGGELWELGEDLVFQKIKSCPHWWYSAEEEAEAESILKLQIRKGISSQKANSDYKR